jgi:hypothetical protein
MYEAEQQRKRRGSHGLLGAIGEPLSYAPGPAGLIGNAILVAQYLTGEKSAEDGLSALAMITGLLQGTKAAPAIRNIDRITKALHGTDSRFDDFSEDAIARSHKADHSALGFFFAPNDRLGRMTANQYAGRKEGSNVRIHNLDTSKHYTFDSSSDHLWREATGSRDGAVSVRQKLLKQGFTTATTPGGELIALDKSAILNGF